MKAIHNLIRWDEYRVRRQELLEEYYKAKVMNARRKAWLFLVKFNEIMREIWHIYRVQH